MSDRKEMIEFDVEIVAETDMAILASDGESGPGARPMHPHWARGLRDQCKAAGVPFFFKQHGEWAQRHDIQCNAPGIKGRQWFNFDPDTSVCRVGKKSAGRLLDGVEHSEYPEATRG